MEAMTLDKFEEAYEVVKEVASETKLVYSDYFSAQTGNKVYLKPENMQLTGAYKLRGAYYKISTLSQEERVKGLITASAGNHAQGVAYDARHIVEDNPSADELRRWHELSGLPLKRFFNTSGMLYREMELSKKLPDLSEEEQYALLATNGMLVKRPLLVGDGFVLAGFRPQEWEERLG